MSFTRLLSALGIVLSATSAVAATPAFTNLSPTDTDNIIREMSANSSWHSVTPPSTMGTIFGFEVGVAAGLTETPEISAITERNGAGKVKYLPHAGLLGVLTTPIPLTAEFLFFPKSTMSGVSTEQIGAAIKWNLSENVLSALPVNLSVRGFYVKNETSFSQTVNDSTLGTPVNTSVAFSGNTKGIQAFVSPRLVPVLEPYIGVGYISADGKLDVTGGNIFTTPLQRSAESSPTSTQLLAGLDVRLGLIGLGVEYNRAFNTNSYNAKLSIKF